MARALKCLNRVIEIGEFHTTWSKEKADSEFKILTEKDFDEQIMSWVNNVYTEFDLVLSSPLLTRLG